MSWLTQGSEMALQDMTMANARLNNVLLKYLYIFATVDKRECQFLLAFLRLYNVTV